MIAEVGAAPVPSLTRRLMRFAPGATPMYCPTRDVGVQPEVVDQGGCQLNGDAVGNRDAQGVFQTGPPEVCPQDLEITAGDDDDMDRLARLHRLEHLAIDVRLVWGRPGGSGGQCDQDQASTCQQSNQATLKA